MRAATSRGFETPSDSGQAMVEFALVLPFLAVITFGTLEVGLFLQQQSSLNCAAFLGARAATVLGNDRRMSLASIQSYTTASGSHWLQTARLREDFGNDHSAYSVQAKAGRLTPLFKLLGFASLDGLSGMTAHARLPLEYTARAGKPRTYKPWTDTQIYYESEPEPIAGPWLGQAGQLASVASADLAKVGLTIGVGEPFSARVAIQPNPGKRHLKTIHRATAKSYLHADYEAKPAIPPIAYKLRELDRDLTSYQTATLPKIQAWASGAGKVVQKVGPAGKIITVTPVIGSGIQKLVGYLAKKPGDLADAVDRNERRLFP